MPNLAVLGLRAAAWLFSIGLGYLLWRHVEGLDLAIFCWPISKVSGAWRIARALTYAAMVPAAILPIAATVMSGRSPRLSTGLALAAIIVMPLLYVALLFWTPSWPR